MGRVVRVIRVGLSLCGPWRLNWGGDAPLPWRLQDLLRSSAGGGSASSELSARRAESRRGSSSSGTAAPYPGVCRTYSGRVQGGVGRRPSPRLAHDYPAASSKATAPGKPAAAAMRTRGLSSCPGWAGKGPLRVDVGGPWELNPTRPPGGRAAGDGVGLPRTPWRAWSNSGYLLRGFEMPLVRMAAHVATVRKGGAWSLPCNRVTGRADASQRRGKGGSVAQRPSAGDVISRAGRPDLCAGWGAGAGGGAEKIRGVGTHPGLGPRGAGSR